MALHLRGGARADSGGEQSKLGAQERREPGTRPPPAPKCRPGLQPPAGRLAKETQAEMMSAACWPESGVPTPEPRPARDIRPIPRGCKVGRGNGEAGLADGLPRRSRWVPVRVPRTREGRSTPALVRMTSWWRSFWRGQRYSVLPACQVMVPEDVMYVGRLRGARPPAAWSHGAMVGITKSMSRRRSRQRG